VLEAEVVLVDLLASWERSLESRSGWWVMSTTTPRPAVRFLCGALDQL
jgi:hypothetical protein